ncbi:hypothetical protein [Microbacterium sp.]|uniref:hypothetical protein n=1 Tax=Microbacterium sp. TaxID=51671 RepID=UPI002810ED2F|nr:hypothetical protein [Microbacterium sp.]
MTHTKAAERRMEQLRDASLDDARLHELIELMLSGALRRQLWLLFLDANDRMSDVILPTDDFPHAPDEPVVSGDLGPTTAARLMAARLPPMCEAIGASQVVLVWEREGDDGFQVEELAWARAISQALHGADVRMRAQFVLHDDGLRALTPDDYAVVN